MIDEVRENRAIIAANIQALQLAPPMPIDTMIRRSHASTHHFLFDGERRERHTVPRTQ
jgi:hypothetical protein